MEKDVLIITGAQVLTCDSANRAGRLDLLIRNGVIAGLAPDASGFRAQNPGAREIDAQGKLITPGFVNAHAHSESLLLRFLTEGRHFDLWHDDPVVLASAARLAEPSSHDSLRALYLAAYFTHLKSGTTLVGEFPPCADPSGIALLAGAIGRTDVRCVLSLQRSSRVDQAKTDGAELEGLMMNLGPEEEYTVYSVGATLRAARDASVPVLAHCAERRESADTIRRNFQKNIGQVLKDLGVLRPDTALAHMNHASELDLDLVEASGSSLILCPRSAAAKQTGYPSLRHLAYRSIRLAIGTDWGQTDMLSELRFLAQLPLLVPSVPVYSPLELLRMATVNGASSLGVGSRTGSLEAGKRADLVFFSLKSLRTPALPPSPRARDLASLVVHHLGAGDITDVMIRGEFCVNNGQLATIVEDDVVQGFRALVDQFFPERTAPAAGAQNRKGARSDYGRPAKIIPLVSREHMVVSEAEGFEEGFSVLGPEEPGSLPARRRVPEVPRPADPMPAPAPPPVTEARTELPKGVRRVFGDDEDL